MPAPGFGREGRRGLQESKPFLSELNKIFHTVRAQHSERRNAASAAAQTNQTTVMNTKDKARKPREFTDKAAWKAHMKAMRQTHKQRRNSKKKSSLCGGGSIWITLKGGFASHNVPHNHKQLQQAAEARVKLSVQRRRGALELAEAYVQSAWEQAREAGLITSANNTNDNNGKSQTAIAVLVPASGVSEDGAQYLQEQYAVAATHLVIPDTKESTSAEIVGSHMRQLIAAHSEAAATAAVAKQPSTTRKSTQHQTANEEEEESEDEQSGLNVPSEPTVLSREEWADLLLREYLITHAIFTAEGLADAQAAVQEEMQTISNPEAVYYIAVVEPCVSDNKERTARQAQNDAPQNGLDDTSNMETMAECADDIVPTKCIVHACNSQRQKATTILSKTKEINIFVSNFMQAVRKELGSSCLPRGPVETTEANATSASTPAGVVGGGHATQSPAANRNANNSNNTNNATHGGKSNTRRKRR